MIGNNPYDNWFPMSGGDLLEEAFKCELFAEC